ncbi:hypothetical protein HPB47_023961 [Ixodes persulcatus]|uniref:Uncharacterized protein n=1 Tax=Ixodes persulcatus TaxID=34615 RepID=A0AC60Q5L3_IXOPE|nr:hypothetical protein HPB47_023961 [Ixodes persulcatus]
MLRKRPTRCFYTSPHEVWEKAQFPHEVWALHVRRERVKGTVWGVANNCAYYGLHINVTNMAGKGFLNVFLLAIIELPTYVVAWWAMERLGRRWSNVGFQLIRVSLLTPTVPGYLLTLP